MPLEDSRARGVRQERAGGDPFLVENVSGVGSTGGARTLVVSVDNTAGGGGGFGGFDNHAIQRDNHAALLEELAESLAAFVADLKRNGLLDRVLLMTFSEFGRRVAEMARRVIIL